MTTQSNISVIQCDDDIKTDYEIIATCINITLFLFGVMYTFFGNFFTMSKNFVCSYNFILIFNVLAIPYFV